MAAQVNCSYPIQIIDDNRNFNANIGQDLNLGNDNGEIAAVSIVGPQNGGKSTLMNKCLSADFKVMDAGDGIHATTRGIWIEKWTSSDCPSKILIVDTEGCDGSKQKGDDRFEKQSAVFVLSISTTVIFNMECRDVDKHNAACRPLLQTVFEVMVRKFTTPRKINLFFVLRNKNKSPLEKLTKQLIDGLHEMWNEKIKPQAANAHAALEDYFKIEVRVMSNYEDKEEQFMSEVGNLREELISQSTSAPLGIPASVFADYARKIWDEIMEDRILNLPLNMITITESFCHRIAEKNTQNFRENESWLQIKRDVESRVRVEGFGNNVSSLIDNCLSEYDNETQGRDTIKRNEIRQQLTEKLVQVVEPTYLELLDQMRIATLANFENAAMDELRTTGVLIGIQTHSFNREFEDQLPDVAVKQASWNHNTVAISKLGSEMASFIQVQQENFKMTEAYCHQIAEKNNQNFRENESWLQIKRDVESRVRVEGFGNNISSLIENCLSEYDNETQGLDTIKRDEIRQQLTEKLVQVVEATYLQLLDQMRIATLAKFENAVMDELRTTGVLVAIRTRSFIREFEDQLPDVAVRQANWNHNSIAISKLESEMASYMDGVSAVNQQLLQEKRDKRECCWLKIARIGSKTLLSFVLMFVPVLGGPLMSAIDNI